MNFVRLTTLLIGLCVSGIAGAADQTALQPWQSPYTADEATGDHVIALWQFDGDNPGKDSSGHGLDLTLRGDETKFVAQGKWGGSLQSAYSGRDHDFKQGAAVKVDPTATPQGPFTAEMWIQFDDDADRSPMVVLLDSKWIYYENDGDNANAGFCWVMHLVGEQTRQMMVGLGFGDHSAFINSEPQRFEPGRWYHVAFTYDGKGEVLFYVNGVPTGGDTFEGGGSLADSVYGLFIGARVSSTNAGFLGRIDQVRLTNRAQPLHSGKLNITAMAGNRTVFERMEPGRNISVTLHNDTGATVSDIEITVAAGTTEHMVQLDNLAADARRTIDVPLDTTVRPGQYDLAISAVGRSSGQAVRNSTQTAVTIVKRHLPNRMPVLAWGGNGWDDFNRLGFTHKFATVADVAWVWEAGKDGPAVPEKDKAKYIAELDDMLLHGIGGVGYVSPGRWVVEHAPQEVRETYRRVDKLGEPTARDNVDGHYPQMQQFFYNVGAAAARTFGDHPAFVGCLIESEIRDGTDISYTDVSRAAYRDFAGYDIPEGLGGKYGTKYVSIPGFPADMIVPDDHPILTFYRWFWKDGDAWSTLFTQTHLGLKSTGRTDLWTFFDPAVRCYSVWGSGGQVDVISQWTYSNPDPLVMGQAADELMAMAAGNPDQQIMKMTQIIWYRSTSAAELPKDEADYVEWERRIPDAQFITIAPDHLSEAFWCKIARPIKGIMYHGWASLVENATSRWYRYTNPHTQHVLAKLTHDVVQPLGPSLLEIPDRPTDVGMLLSFTSQMFASRGTFGGGDAWESHMHLILQHAQLQPIVLYEETINRDGLDDYKVLVMPACDVLPRSVYEKIAAWQRRGGIIVADEYLTPALMPDMLIESFKRPAKADEFKVKLLEAAVALRQQLDPFYERYAQSDTPHVITRVRRYGSSDYLFAINDHRTFGDYVGHHGQVMEKGLPIDAIITVNRPGGYVYDLVAHEQVDALRQSNASMTAISVSLEAGGGRMYMITDRPIDAIKVSAPANAQRGDAYRATVVVADDTGAPIDAVVPVSVELIDPEGNVAEFSGYYAAVGGTVDVAFDLASNDLPGQWTLRATELASATVVERSVAVK
jgi:hypothetical protein